jgi:GTP-binding protein
LTGADPADAARALEEGRLLFAQPCRFLISAARADQLPEADLPEIAFAGRSNVGKSSLVNALTGRRTLAGGRVVLVDLPGYGYARASKTAIRQWTGLTRHYLKGRAGLQRVCLLIDARHGLKAADLEIMAMLDGAAVSYQAVLTKADKTKPGALAETVTATAARLARHPAAHPEILITSALAGTGIAELRAAIAMLAAPAPAR